MKPDAIKDNVFQLIGKDWCLIAASKGEHFNMMTASWGGFGVLWNKRVATIYIRPQRYTKEFVDNNTLFTLSFFDESYRKILTTLGTRSGRDMKKESESGLHPKADHGVVMFEEARLTMVCRKIYQDTIKPENFLDSSIQENYPEHDYHDVYIGEIVDVIER